MLLKCINSTNSHWIPKYCAKGYGRLKYGIRIQKLQLQAMWKSYICAKNRAVLMYGGEDHFLLEWWWKNGRGDSEIGHSLKDF